MEGNLVISINFHMSAFTSEFSPLEIRTADIIHNKESKKLLIIICTIIFMKMLYYTIKCKIHRNFRDVNI